LIGALGAGAWWAGEKLYDSSSQSTKDKLHEFKVSTLDLFGNKAAHEELATINPKQLLQNLGWMPDQAEGILTALAKMSGLDPHATGDHGKSYGLGLWNAIEQGVFKKLFGHDIRDSTRGEQFDFLNYELVRGFDKRAGDMIRNAESIDRARDYMWRYYHQAALPDNSKQGGNQPVQISQDIDIHVQGATDPKATADRVARAQDRVNANIMRNAIPPVR